MKTQRLVILNVIIILVIIVAGFLGYYMYNQSTLYLKTDDATVTGQQIVIASPATGKLSNWSGTNGTRFDSGDTVGQVTGAGGTTANIPMPQAGTVVQNDALNNEYVQAGSPLAYAYNLNNLDITANIKETQIQDIKVGDTVDVYFPSVSGSITGTVKQIGLATASTFSLLPSTSTNANFTKVTQVIPVTITLSSVPPNVVPGMSATVRIHK